MVTTTTMVTTRYTPSPRSPAVWRLPQVVTSCWWVPARTKAAGLYISGGLVENCLFSGNFTGSTGYGGAIYMTGGIVRNCTVVNNTSGRGVVYATGGTLENSIVWGNTIMANYPEVVATSSAVTIRNCFLPALGHDNTATVVDSIITNVAPAFSDAVGGNYRLTPGSLCIDAGSSVATPHGAQDLDGTPRTIAGGVDIGAYEFDPGTGLRCGIRATREQAFDALTTTLRAIVYNYSGVAEELEYLWQIGETTVGTQPELPLTLTEYGYHNVTLTVTDASASAFQYCCSVPAPTGEGSFTADPLFTASGVYTLPANSPCVNRGRTDPQMFTATDLAGNQRVRQGKVDLGAYEYMPPAATIMQLR